MNVGLPSLLTYSDDQRALVFRPARPEQAEEVVAAVEESLEALRQFMPWAHLPQTVENQRERLTRCWEDYLAGGDRVYHVYERGSDRMVACIGLHHRTLNPRALEIGYWVRTSAAGQGLATLATQCMCVLCFEVFDCDRVQCGYNEANVGSRRVNEKVGFNPEVRLRNFEMQPTNEMRVQGCLIQPMMIMNALFPDDRSRLEWYPRVAHAMSVFDAQGKPIPIDIESRDVSA